MSDLTTELARHIAASSWPSVDEAVGDEAVRALVNWLGCALAGSRDAYLDVLPDDDADESLTGAEATVLGLDDRADLATAIAVTAVGADSLGYGETHAPTLLAPGAVVGGALLPLAECRDASGAAFVHAFALGTEVACRVAMARDPAVDSPALHAMQCCALGAAAAAANLLGLDAGQALHALGMTLVESNTALGAARRQSTLPGIAAKTAAACSLRVHGGHRPPHESFDQSMLDRFLAHGEASLAGWGRDWQIGRLAYHAYPCALFLHPVIEACLQLKRGHHLTGRQIAAVRIRMHPSQLALDSGAEPGSSRAARQSVAHAATIALLDGEAGLTQFEHAKLRNGRVKEMRTRIDVVPDESLPDTGAHVTIEQPGGGQFERYVRCALGHPMRPLGDHELSEKFRGLAAESLATSQAERLLGLAWNVRALPGMGGLVRTTVPEDVYEPAELPGSPLIPR